MARKMKEHRKRYPKFDPKHVKLTRVQAGSAIQFTEKGQSVAGWYDGARKVDTENGETFIHTIDDGNGHRYELWESFALKSLHQLPIGAAVRVTFNGEKKLKAGRRLKDFIIESDAKLHLEETPF